EGLKQFLKENAKALEIARVGLQRECRDPPQEITLIVQKHHHFNRLFELLDAEGLLAEKESRFSDAKNSYLDICKLGFLIMHGADAIDFGYYSCFLGIGNYRLKNLAENLGMTDSRELIAALEKMTLDDQLIQDVHREVLELEARNFSVF